MKATASKSTRKPASRANGSKTNGSKSNASKSQPSEDSSKLHKLFEEELKDIYWAEKALTKAIPKMIKKATSEDLIEALENHLEETEGQVQRCEQIFELLGKSAQAKKCEAMDGLITEAEDIMSESDEGVMRDAGIISAAQKVEHYEIASYGTLRQFAKTLGLTEIADLLEETLNEEKNADETLTSVAESAINVKAAQTSESEEEEEEEVEKEE
ncbi:MAG TPA: ferritin-like domain-containing protein [Cyclobacteriaceae bacterium]|nr:ferritin-like domain-containing protein [Cyclobacteriaceae bacterium]